MALDFGTQLFKQSKFSESQEGLTGEEQVWSCSGNSFIPTNPDINDVGSGFPVHGARLISEDNITVLVPVYLPNKATIHNAGVWGGGVSDGWSLVRSTITSTSSTIIASGQLTATEETSQIHSIVDNEKFYYWFIVENCLNNAFIRAAKINYTT